MNKENMNSGPAPPPERPPKRLGRPKTAEANKVVKKSVSLPSNTYEYLISIGNGVLSHGVTKAAIFHQDHFSKKQGKTS